MKTRQNIAKQEFRRKSVIFNNTVRIDSPRFDTTAWVARRCRVTPSTARLIAELAKIGGVAA